MANKYVLAPIEYKQNDSLGNAVVNCSVTIYTDSARTTQATVYTTQTGNTAVTQPMTTNSFGQMRIGATQVTVVWAPPGTYYFKAVGTGADATVNGVLIGAFSDSTQQVSLQVPITIYIDFVNGNDGNPLPGPYKTCAGAIAAAPNLGKGHEFVIIGDNEIDINASATLPNATSTVTAKISCPAGSTWRARGAARGTLATNVTHLITGSVAADAIMDVSSGCTIENINVRNTASDGFGFLADTASNVKFIKCTANGAVYSTYTGTATTSNASKTLTSCVGFSSADIGSTITGTNIPAATTIISATGSTVYISNNATGSGSGITMTVTGPRSLGKDGFKFQGFGIDSLLMERCYSTGWTNAQVNANMTTLGGGSSPQFMTIHGGRFISTGHWAILIASDGNIDSTLNKGRNAIFLRDVRIAAGGEAGTRGANGMTTGGIGIFGMTDVNIDGVYDESTSTAVRAGPAIVIDQALNNSQGLFGYARNIKIAKAFFNGKAVSTAYPASTGLYIDAAHCYRVHVEPGEWSAGGSPTGTLVQFAATCVQSNVDFGIVFESAAPTFQPYTEMVSDAGVGNWFLVSEENLA